MKTKLRFLLPLLLLSIVSVRGFGQSNTTKDPFKPDDDEDTSIHHKKPWLLLTGFDVALGHINGKYNYAYEGEYLPDPGLGDWAWKKISFHDKNNMATITDIKIDILISRSRAFRYGLTYNFSIPNCYPYTVGLDQTGNLAPFRSNQLNKYFFLGIGALGQYNYYFKKDKINSPYAYGSGAIGFYRGPTAFEGPGQNYYLQGRLGIGFQFKKYNLIHAFISYDYFRYHERSTSVVFDQQQKVDIGMQTIYFGIGYAREHVIIPN